MIANDRFDSPQMIAFTKGSMLENSDKLKQLGLRSCTVNLFLGEARAEIKKN